jgi:diadenosine tetraphosphatase ApaH/serine/threonine PP2A family protein phosphatase
VRYLALSDIHANLQALEAVLEDASRRGYDAVVVLGDLVGYGADPAAVIDRVLALSPAALIRGNHDKVCAGLDSAMQFNDIAQQSIDWTRARLSAAHLATLLALPAGPMRVTDGLEICHGAPFDEDHYIFDERDVLRAIDAASERVCLFGHTHLPGVFARTGADSAAATGDPGVFTLPLRRTALINVGSVGQPRDGDWRAAYGIVDLAGNTLEMYRVEYDVAEAQARIRAAGLPDWLAARLERGQ